MATRVLKVEIVGDARGFQRAVNDIEGHTKRLSSGFSKATSLIGAGFAGLAGSAVIGGIKSLIDEAREAEKVSRQTAAVIKATGGVANVSAKDVDRLTTSLSNKVGVDDDLIATGANLLLTFKNVRNETGRNNDIFNQATRAAVDMTAAMNNGEVTADGLKSANVQLGKALNDPIAGLTALTRVGVTFTDKQKEQIKTLVEAGDTMGAQKVILKELTSEFGGAAKAASDPWQRLQTTLGNVKEDIGEKLLPTFNRLADWLAVRIPKAIDDLKASLRTAKEWWDKNYEAVSTLITTFSGSYVTASGDAEDATKDLRTSAEKLRDSLDTVLKWALYLAKGYGILAAGAQYVSVAFLNIVKAAGYAINVIDRLSGGTGHAGDKFVDFANDGLTKAHRMLDKIADQAGQTQKEIDKLHGKNVIITAKGYWAGISGSNLLAEKGITLTRAAGGPIIGPGTSTSDSIPALLSTGEHVLSAREVMGLGGHAAVAQMRRSARGFAAGGPVGSSLGLGPAIQTSIDRLAAAIDRLTAHIPIAGANIPHVAGAWKMALSFLQSAGVPYNVVSTFRPGARTHASGAVSFHALNRAVDITGPNMLRIWQALTGTNPTELIYSGAPMYKSRRGWRPIGQLDPITLADHWSHVHAAYDRGGWLEPGWTMAWNGTGRPERVSAPGAGGGISVSFYGPVYGDRRALTETVRQGIREALRREGRPVTV